MMTHPNPLDFSWQTLKMEIERFTVPEVLFSPSDIQLKQAGLAEALVQSVSECDIGVQGGLYANIVVVGGNAKFPGLRERLETEVRGGTEPLSDLMLGDHRSCRMYACI
jgi:actin-related protein 6